MYNLNSMLATLRISSDQSKSMSIHLLIADANFDTNFQCCHFEQFIDDLKLQMNMPAAELKCTYVCLWFNECFKKNQGFLWCDATCSPKAKESAITYSSSITFHCIPKLNKTSTCLGPLLLVVMSIDSWKTSSFQTSFLL